MIPQDRGITGTAQGVISTQVVFSVVLTTASLFEAVATQSPLAWEIAASGCASSRRRLTLSLWAQWRLIFCLCECSEAIS